MQVESSINIRVFTTKAEELFGVSFLAISPEHELLQRKELFTDSALRAVDEMKKRLLLTSATGNINYRAKQG